MSNQHTLQDAAGNAEARPADGIPEDANRASRAMLSNSTASLPEKLVAEMPIPDGCAMHCTVHCDSTLPHFQGRLLHNQCFEGKWLGLHIILIILRSSQFDSTAVSFNQSNVIDRIPSSSKDIACSFFQPGYRCRFS